MLKKSINTPKVVMMRTSIINHPENEPLIIIRQWQSDFCDGNEVAAALMSFFEYWHNIKLDIQKQTEKANEVREKHGDNPLASSLYQWHTESELIAGIQRIAKTGKTLSKGIDLLESKGAITVHKNPNPRYKFDKTRHFLFHPEPINEWLSTEYRSSIFTSSSSKNTLRSSKNNLPSSKNTPAIPEITTETTPESSKASSAKADYSRPISLLSEKEIKALKLPLSTWKEYLTDEQAERQRKGVIKFLEAKIDIGPLLPDTEPAKLLFEKLAVEAEAKGRRPASKFPTLACKEKFNKAAGRLNGTLEVAIDSGLAAGITAIPRLVNYISSPKWAEGTNERSRESATRTGQRQTYGTTGQPTKDPFAPAPGSGQTPEMAAKLRTIFARD
jgi:hypothetical protein